MNRFRRSASGCTGSIEAGDAALGIESEDGERGDGVLIRRVLPGSAAAAAGLRRGDVIVSVDGRATRRFAELVAIIAAKQVGDQVLVRYRRSGEYGTVRVRLTRRGRPR